jgi:hypothetical protein
MRGWVRLCIILLFSFTKPEQMSYQEVIGPEASIARDTANLVSLINGHFGKLIVKILTGLLFGYNLG